MTVGKGTNFSINIDECTSDKSQEIFSILVSYFDVDIGESVVQHYESVSLREVCEMPVRMYLQLLYKRWYLKPSLRS